MGKYQISIKDTISIGEFMSLYLNDDYGNKVSTHEQMMRHLLDKGKRLPTRVNMDEITKEDILSGKYLFVRAERKSSDGKHFKANKKVKVLAYENPLYFSVGKIMNDLDQKKKTEEELRHLRNIVLKEQQLIEDELGYIVDLEIYEMYNNELETTEKVNRTKKLHMNRSMGRR